MQHENRAGFLFSGNPAVCISDSIGLYKQCTPLLLAVKEHLKNGGAISPQFPILVMIDVLYSHFLTTDSERKEALYEYAVTKLHET